MKKRVIIIVFMTMLTLSAFFLIAFVNAYTDSGNRFSITPPSGWTPKEGVQGIVVQFVGPEDPDVGTIKINVAIQSTDQTLQQIIDNTKQSWSATYTNYSLNTDRDTTINGYSAHELETTASQNGSPFGQDTVFIVQSGQLFQLSYVAGPTTYSTYFDKWSNSAYTLQINASASPSPSVPEMPYWILGAIVIVAMIVVVATKTQKPKHAGPEPQRTFQRLSVADGEGFEPC